jgi:hypothetical protein
VPLVPQVPGILDHYVARTAIRTQQTRIDADPDRPGNLWHPVDDPPGSDRGARGIFGHLEGGVLQPRFRRTIPRQVKTVLRSTGDRLHQSRLDRRR